MRLAWQVERWNGFAGNVLDQDANLVTRLASALNVYDAFNSYRQSINSGTPGAEWADNNPGAWRIICEVENLRHGRS